MDKISRNMFTCIFHKEHEQFIVFAQGTFVQKVSLTKQPEEDEIRIKIFLIK